MANLELVNYGKSFLADVLKHVPEDSRAAAEAALVTSERALEVLGDGVKRNAEGQRLMEEARRIQTQGESLYNQNKAWFDANKPLVDLGKAAQDAGWTPVDGGDATPRPPLTTPNPNMVDRAVLDQTLNEREAGAAVFMAKLTQLGINHYVQFGEVLDTTALLNDPQVAKLGLEAGYRAAFAEKIQAKATTAENARIEQRVQEGVQAALKTRQSAPPYPVTSGAGSPLDALTPVDGKPMTDFSVEAAAADYDRLVAAKSGAAV